MEKFLFKNLCIGLLSLLAKTSMAGDFIPKSFQTKTSMNGIPLGEFMNIYEGDSSSAFEQAFTHLTSQKSAYRSTQEVPNFGLDPIEKWAYFRLHNPLPQHQTVYLEHTFTLADHVYVYYRNKGEWILKKGGEKEKFSQRDLATRQNLFIYDLPPGTSEFVVSTQADGAIQIPFYIWTPQEFTESNFLTYGAVGLLLGFLFVIALYNFFLFLSLWDSTYLLYVFYILANAVYQMTYNGALHQLSYHIIGWETLHNQVMLLLIEAIIFTSLAFTWKFLGGEKMLAKLKPFYLCAAAISLINIAIATFSSIFVANIITMLRLLYPF